MTQPTKKASSPDSQDAYDCPRARYCGYLGLASIACILISVLEVALSVPGNPGEIRFAVFLISVTLGLILAVAAVVRGHQVRSWRYTRPLTRREKCGAFGDLIGGYSVMILVGAAFVLPALSSPPPPHCRVSCANNLKQLGLVCVMFGNENKGQFFPELSPKSGRLAMLNKSAGSEGPIIPEYLSDPTLFFCPLAPEHNVRPGNDTDETPDPQTDFLDKSSYMYLGFAVTNETELQAFADAYRDRIAKGLRLNVDLPVAPGSGTLGRDKLLRLRDELEKQFVADPGDRTACAKIAASIPVLVERLGHHKPEGGNVLYLDGHVEFIRYPGKFPMTETGMEILTSLESQFSTE